MRARAKAKNNVRAWGGETELNGARLLKAVALSVLLGISLHYVGLPEFVSGPLPSSALTFVLLTGRIPRAKVGFDGKQLLLTYDRPFPRCFRDSRWSQSLQVPLVETAVYKGYEGTAVTMTWADGTNWTLPGGFAWLLEPLQKQFAELGLPPFVIYHRSYVAFAPLEQSSETTAVR